MPLDEYATYVGPVASILERAHEASASLAPRSDDDEVQWERNRLWGATVDELASHLAHTRETMMETPLDQSVERHAAEVLLDRYGWEMNGLEHGHFAGNDAA
ncbi:MAG TPA: hypothetical protein VJ716_09920 [Gaiellaceae bacterium]|nr:hypothetical protein [Gaiellaceae bacterium]